MSHDRIRLDAGWVYSAKEKGPNGRGLCRLCSVEVGGGRRTFCSDDCVHRWKIQTQPGYVRTLVERRDHGVCAQCGLDTEAIRAELSKLRASSYGAWKDRCVETGFPKCAIYPGDFWQADHCLSVVEGGGGTGLENYQTLCTPCHKIKTAELRARMKQQRILAKESASITLPFGTRKAAEQK